MLSHILFVIIHYGSGNSARSITFQQQFPTEYACVQGANSITRNLVKDGSMYWTCTSITGN